MTADVIINNVEYVQFEKIRDKIAKHPELLGAPLYSSKLKVARFWFRSGEILTKFLGAKLIDKINKEGSIDITDLKAIIG